MTSNDRYYVSTTIPYVNGRPHIGHAEEFVQTDVFGRYHRALGADTYVLTGTDENSLTNVLAAEREGMSPRELVDRNSLWFKGLADDLGFHYDQFIRTSVDPRHAAASQKIWLAVAESGDIYKRSYGGLYCVRCEQYYSEDELIDGSCPEHGIPPELVEEENYFFRLSRYGDELYDLIQSDRLRIIPDFRKNEVLSFISQGLQDFSVSRSFNRAHGWGIPVPNDPSQVMYVWFDALTNYISALDYADNGDLYRRYWTENPHRVHALGKGVVRFHAIYWPAMLLSAHLPLPHTEFVHGYINIAGAKMSKTLGNTIDPSELVESYGRDAVRYFLLRGISATRDADFADVDGFHDQLRSRYNADLANDLGNLVNRTVTMIRRYAGGVIPDAGAEHDLSLSVQALALAVQANVRTAMSQFNPQEALDAIWELVTRANKFVEESSPWSLAKAAGAGDFDAESRLRDVLFALAESVRCTAVLLEPFMPDTASGIQQQLGLQPPAADTWQDRLAWGGMPSATMVAEPNPLFPRLDVPVLQ